MPHKDYLKFVSESSFGVVGSGTAPVRFVQLKNQTGRYIASPTCENVTIWDLKTREKEMTLHGDHHAVTALAYKADDQLIAAGYQNGAIRVFSLESGMVKGTFAGHRSAVTCLAFDSTSCRLATGGQDCTVQLWDTLGEEGLFSLMGHKNGVTQVHFLRKHPNILITSSKDMLIKFWNLDIQHCFKTILSTNQEVLSFVVLRDDSLMVSAPVEGNPIIWQLKPAQEEEEGPQSKVFKDDLEDSGLTVKDDDSVRIPLEVEQIGVIDFKEPLLSMASDPSQSFFCCYMSDHSLHIFRVASEKELLKKAKRKKDKALAADMLIKFTPLKAKEAKSRKIKSVDLLARNNKLLITATLANNTIAFLSCNATVGPDSSEQMQPLLKAGHRRFPLALTYCGLINGLISLSSESLRHWYLKSPDCPRSQPLSKCALCMTLAPKESHIIIGNKDGSLSVHNTLDLQEVSTVEDAHSSPIRSLCIHSDQTTLISAGTDKIVKFWSLKYKKNKSVLTLVNRGEQPVEDEVLGVKCSFFGTDTKKQVLAVALFNCHVAIFHLDTMKFSLKLTGHSQPVQCMDISDDNQIIATGGGDKTIKIWGLAYGQCLKSIFAHDNKISCLKFNSGSHMFFSGSLDTTIKHWDGDTYEKIVTLRGHQSEVMDLATFPNGTDLASCSRDFSIRTWVESDEVVLVEEQREMELDREILEENLYEENLPKMTRVEVETGTAGTTTGATLDLADKLMEYLELYQAENEALLQYRMECQKLGKQLPPPKVHDMFKAFNVAQPLEFISAVLSRNVISDMDRALQKLPFTYAHQMLKVLAQLLKKRWNEYEASHYALLLLRQHENQLVFGQSFAPLLESLAEHAVPAMQSLTEQCALAYYGTCDIDEALKLDQESFDFAKELLEMQEPKK